MSEPEIINTGSLPNDGTGDPLQTAFEKINNNFAVLFTANLSSSSPSGTYTSSSPGSYTYSTGPDSPAGMPATLYSSSPPPSGPFTTPSAPLSSTPPLTVNYTSTPELVNIGALPNDGTGDPLRVAFGKINNNFTSLYLTTTNVSNTYTSGNTAGQVIWEIPVGQFAQGTFQIRSGDPSNQDSQDITIAAQITNNLLNIKWNGYGTTFNGNAITTYDMDVFAGNVRLMVNPLANTVLQHLVSSSVTYINPADEVLPIELDGYAPDSLLTTEDDFLITTE